MRRPDAESLTEHPLASVDTESFKEWKHLRSFFFDLRYEGGLVEREPGLAMVTATMNGWVITLKENTAATQMRVSAPTFDEGLLLADTLLGDPRAPWVPDLWARQKRKGGRK